QVVWGPELPVRPGSIWLPGSTWNEARNRLYAEVRGGASHYRYLVFLDEDVSLSLRPSAVDAPGVQEDPWREYERLLIEWAPAVGVPRYTVQQPEEEDQEEPDVQCVHFMDPLVVSIHFEAAALLLPYTNHFDSESWWYSAVVANALAAVHFPGHVIQFNSVYSHDDPQAAGYTAFRQMLWHRPIVWLIPAVPRDKFHLLNVRDPTKVGCTDTGGVKKRSTPYVIPSGQFEPCHPVFRHLGRGLASDRTNCTSWDQDTSLAHMTIVLIEDVRDQASHSFEGIRGLIADARREHAAGMQRVEAEVEALRLELRAGPPRASDACAAKEEEEDPLVDRTEASPETPRAPPVEVWGDGGEENGGDGVVELRERCTALEDSLASLRAEVAALGGKNQV
ncbi:hypothetical protein T484DRAFT_1941295, partial [Baffinella frigidus]